MTRTFPAWPQPVEGHATFTAPCPSGFEALWEQTGNRPGAVDIHCSAGPGWSPCRCSGVASAPRPDQARMRTAAAVRTR
jgi:hypothetical protein